MRPRMTRVLADVLGWNPEQAGHGTAGGNPFAAMPSLHFALTVLVVLALWRRPKLRAAAVLYLAAMGFTLVYGGEHYVIDLLVGAAVAVAAWLVATRLVGSPTPLQPVEDRTELFMTQAQFRAAAAPIPHGRLR